MNRDRNVLSLIVRAGPDVACDLAGVLFRDEAEAAEARMFGTEIRPA